MGHTVIGGKHTCRREPAASPRRAPAAPRRFATQGPGAQLPVTCEDATAANVGTRGARAPGRGGERRAAATRPPLAPVTPAGPALVRLRGCTLATSDADARDKAENKKERPRTPQTGLRRGKEPSHSPSRWRRPRGDGSGPSRAPVTGCGPGASRGVGGEGCLRARRGVSGRGSRAGEGRGEEGGQGGPGTGARAPRTHLLPRLRLPLKRCGPGSRTARRSPAAGLALSLVPRRAPRPAPSAAASLASAAASPRPRTAPAAWGGGGAASAGRRGRGRARTPAPRCARPGPRPPLRPSPGAAPTPRVALRDAAPRQQWGGPTLPEEVHGWEAAARSKERDLEERRPLTSSPPPPRGNFPECRANYLQRHPPCHTHVSFSGPGPNCPE